mmetsp:Transcript_6712/g.16381  ORF Transcript_6712/g.16381 Transcript_6712/m.16381 type:complete len:103 (-) Transcript_6712:140-448(-)
MKKPPFNQLIKKSDVPVLVDFYADWCGPCQTLSPIVQEVAKSLSGKVKVIKINVDKNNALAAQFNIRSIPTLILFKNGAPAWRKAGLLTKREMIKNLESKLS